MDKETLDRIKKLNGRMLNIATDIKMQNELLGRFPKLTLANKKKLEKIENWLNKDYKRLCRL